MSAVMAMRDKYKDKFKEQKGVNLGFMSFFTKAVTEALRQFPTVNGQIDGDEIITHDYADIGIAVSSPKGLMVPVIRNAERMSLAEIEGSIKALAVKARDGKLTLDEMTGGTFTITNGGIYGSMLSTPILNAPQSGILGMHNIVQRPVVMKDGKIVEEGSREDVIGNPQHPYTKRLLLAVPECDPRVDAEKRRERQRMLAEEIER
jgi:2-oxoglutarate dehydrogenase E2 component (dihydrolipoamide succinyltransferase)